MADEGAKNHTPSDREPVAEGPLPFMQQVLDNPFLLLFIGVTMPTVFYILWGVLNVISIPLAD